MIPARMRMPHARRLLIAAVGLGLMAAACGPDPAGRQSRTVPPGPVADRPTASPPQSSPSRPPEASSTTPAPAPPRFHGSSAVIDGATRASMAASWHEGCPVPIEDLRLLTMDFWGFDGRIHRGEMVINAKVASDVLTVFGQLFERSVPHPAHGAGGRLRRR